MTIGATGRLARASAKRPLVTLGVWALGLAAAILAAGSLGDALTQDDQITIATESGTVDDLDRAYRSDGTDYTTETIIVRSNTDVRFGDPAFTDALELVTAAVGGVEGVTEVSTPTLAAPFGVSASGTTALITVTGDPGVIINTYGAGILDAVDAAQVEGFTVLPFGNSSASVSMDALAEETLAKGEMIGIGVALVILAVVFGALMAAGVPVLMGIVSIITALGFTAIVGQIFEMSFFVINMIAMMGLALSIDYTLIQVQRFREERAKGRSVMDAVTIAGSTANRAVLVSGLTVVVSLAGLLAVPSTIMRSLGGGAILVAIASLLTSLTLLPAVLRLIGDRINKGRIPTAHPGQEPRRWNAIARLVIRRPGVSALVGLGAMLLLAAPVIGMRLAFPGLDSLPEDNGIRQAQNILVDDFGWGRNASVIAIENASGATAQIDSLAAAIEADPGFAETTIDSYGDVVFIDTKDVYDSADVRADEASTRLHDELIPAHLGDTEAVASLGGQQWGSMEFTNIILDSIPLVLLVVLGSSFLLLLVAFRSLVIPLTGIVLNLLSTLAAYGLMVAVFQYGWGADLLGLPQVAGIAPWLPLFLFAVLFGLSMDYHVFLLSRIKEHHELTGDTRESIVKGLGRTGSLITGAALIMVAVFGGFAGGDLAEFAQMGFGLGAAVIIDATLVRVILVPAVMALLGRANWYLPSWLEWLPAMSIEGRAREDAPDEDLLEPALVPARV